MITIHPGLLAKEVEVPSSKSYLNRGLIHGSLRKGLYTLRDVKKFGQDVTELITALRKVGLDIKVLTNEMRVDNSFPECEKGDDLCEIGPLEGGTSSRFLVTLLSLGARPYQVHLIPSMSKRPWEELLDALRELGAKIEKNENSLFIQGPIQKKKIKVSCSRSSQFASALQLTFQEHWDWINIQDHRGTTDYLAMTREVLETQDDLLTPLDKSAQSFFIALGTFLGPLKILGLSKGDPLQCDDRLIDLVLSLGGTIRGDQVFPSQLQGDLQINARDYPDLVMTLIFLSCYKRGTALFQNLDVLRNKESDRLQESLKILELFSIDYKFDGTSLEIEGNQKKITTPVHYNAPEDHRMAFMAASFMAVNGGGTLENEGVVKKSFPDFFDSFYQLS